MKITETRPGHIDLSCDKSGSNRPITRTGKFGMFCDADPCPCEIKSKALMEKAQGMMAAFMAASPDKFR